MKKTFLIILIFIILFSNIAAVKQFAGYSSKSSNTNYSVTALLDSKHFNDSNWNENYFHEAQFLSEGITIFTNIIFSNSFFDKKSCKLNSIITFKNGKKYIFNKDFEKITKNINNANFALNLDNNYVVLEGNNYKIHIEDSNINLNLNYKIVNQPHIFGDGIVNLDSKNFLAFSQPIAGAVVSGTLKYENSEIKLIGKGSLNHDYNLLPPVKNPKKWRSFWLYDDKYTVLINTFILNDNTQIDRVVIYKDNKLLKSFLNCGLETKNYQIDQNTGFSYPAVFSINYKDSDQDEIKAELYYKNSTDKIKAFEQLSPVLHKIVASVVGEMWVYRFWADAEFTLKVNGNDEHIKISGLGNFVDMVK